MKITLKMIEKEIKKIAKIEPGETSYDTHLFLLASAVVGPNIRRISKFTKLPLARVTELSRLARKNKIFVGHKIAVEWFEKNGGIALTLDAMVLDGLLEKVTKNG